MTDTATNPNAAINEIADRFFEGVLEREPIFATIRECEDGRDIKALLKGPVAHSSFTRLN